MCFQFLEIGFSSSLILFFLLYKTFHSFKFKTIKEYGFYCEYHISYIGQCVFGKNTCLSRSQDKQVGDFAREWQTSLLSSMSFCISISDVEECLFPTASSTEYVGTGIYWNFANLKVGISVQFILLLLWYEKGWVFFHVLKGNWHLFFCELLPFFIRLLGLFLYNF